MEKGQAAAELRKFADFVKGLTDAADVLDDLQRAESLTASLAKQADDARADLAATQATLAAARDELADVRSKSNKSVADARKKIDDRLAEVQAQADTLVADAKASAAATTEAALVDIDAKRTAAQTELAGMGAQLVDMQARMDELQATLAEKAAALADIEARIAAAREAAAKMLG